MTRFRKSAPATPGVTAISPTDDAHRQSRRHAAHDSVVSSPPQRLTREMRSGAGSKYVHVDRRTRHVSNRDQRDVLHDSAAYDRSAGKACRALRVPLYRHTALHHCHVANELMGGADDVAAWMECVRI